LTNKWARNVVIGLWFVWLWWVYQCGKINFNECHRESDVLSKTSFATLDTTVRKVVIKKLAFLLIR
jgi:hypothetical protein